MALQPVDPKLLFSKSDPLDPRLGDLATDKSGTENFIVVGYPDDEGISLNGGRVGAAQAPNRIRSYFYKMTPPAFQDSKNASVQICDAGNLVIQESLSDRHLAARSFAASTHKRSVRIISLGGGHDYGFPDAAAYCEAVLAQGERPLVINFDAHLDVRPLNRGLTSGTPFFRLLEEFPDIDFIELGLQSQCNSKSHVDWLIERGGLVAFEEVRHARKFTLTETLNEILTKVSERKISPKRSAFLSVDIDGFSSSVAPGASQSWPTGFAAQDFFECFSWCLKKFDVRAVGIYEVSPPLDVDDRTSRLAALIAHRFVFQF